MKEKKTTIPFNQSEISSYLKDLRKIEVMTTEREKEIADLMRSGTLTPSQVSKINEEIVRGNLRFVITIAKQYQNQGLDLPDLIAEGNIGLMKAAQNFDWNKNLKFISYAVWWIRQSILYSLNENARTIRLPVNVVQDVQKEKKAIENGTGVKSDKYANLPSMIWIDKPINDDGDTLVDIICNNDASKPDDSFNNGVVLRDKLFELLGSLDDRERTIIEDYYGLTGSCRTLEDIGDDFNLTKERIRQIKEKGLRKLRNGTAILFDYI